MGDNTSTMPPIHGSRKDGNHPVARPLQRGHAQNLSMSRLQTSAPAKVNLTLRVLSRRPDGYHELASLVAFATVGDDLLLEPAATIELEVVGPMGPAAGIKSDNLVLKAARAFADRVPGLQAGHFVLTKNLPSGAGLGGGSSDAAAALRLLAQLNGLAIDDLRVADAAVTVGADVPACMEPRARLIHGIGDELSSPVDLPALDAVIVFPGTGVATSDVFRAHMSISAGRGRYLPSQIPTHRAALLEFLALESNDLENAATDLVPAIRDARSFLGRTERPELTRMTGSGSAVFAIYVSADAASKAAARIRDERPDWWVAATTLR
jgi:4-diphosphocytidyl-2-C-methyl-D-erythritol kinase